RNLLTTIKHYYVWREKGRSDMIRVAAVLRQWHLVLATRFVERGWIDREDDYFFLLFDEIADAIASARGSTSSPGAEPGRPAASTRLERVEGRVQAELRSLVSARRAQIDRDRRLEMPLLMRESQLPALLRAPLGAGAIEAGDLRGTPVSRGVVESEVVVITDPADFATMRRGAILVTR